MKIPFEDSRCDMKRRWTDFRKMKQALFHTVYDNIDGCSDFSREELLQLRELIQSKTDSSMDKRLKR